MVEQKQTRMAVDRAAGPTGPMSPVAAQPGVPTLTPKEIAGILRRHILLIVFMTILGLIVGGVGWYLLRKYVPKYTARTYIRVLPPVERHPMVVGTGVVASNIQYSYRQSMASLMRRQQSLEDLLRVAKVQETKWFRKFGEIKDVKMQKALKDLQGHLGARAERDAEFVTVSMTCGDAEESALIVNEMIDMFLKSQGVTKRREVAERMTRLEEQRVRLERDLNDAERAMADLRVATKFTDLKERGDLRSTIRVKLDNLELRQNDLILGIKQIQADIENLERMATGPILEQVEHQIERDPLMVVLAQQRDLLEAMLAGTLTKFGENHRVVRQTRERIDEIREKRRIRKAEIAEQTRRANLQNGQDRLLVLQSRLEELETMRLEAEAKKKDLDLARAQYERRVAVRDERKQRLDETKALMEALKIMHDDPRTPKVRFVGYAPVPLEVSSPRWKLYFPGGTVLGLMLGVGLTFLIELLNDLVRTPRDVGRYLHIPLLGVIPDEAEDEQVRDVDLCLAVRQAPYSIISESYRRFRANLKLSGPGESSKVLLISSGVAGDGKTSVAVNLAMTFIAESKKVLLIDANFWQPGLHTLFPKTQDESDKQSARGLSNILSGQYGYEEVIRSSGIEGLDVIDSGPLPSNLAELLGGPQMKQLIEQQRQSYDYVIVDGPPVLLVSDTKVLARLVDGTVLVFNAGTTRRGAALRTIGELRQVNATIVGCVLFAVRSIKGGYFHEQFKSYQEYQKLQLARSI